MLPPATDVDVDGVCGMLLVLKLEEDLRWRDGVGCVAPVSWWFGFGSPMSTGKSDADVELDDCEALDVTDALWARSAVSSRVSRLTYACSVNCHVRRRNCTHHRLILLLALIEYFGWCQRSWVPQWYAGMLAAG